MKSLTCILAACVVLVLSGSSQATPLSGATCANCHRAGTGHMSVVGTTVTKDLTNRRLDHLQPGALKVFTVKRGAAVNLQVKVTNGASKYAVELKGLDKAAILYKATNKLVYTADPKWIKTGTPPYFVSTRSSTAWANTAKVYTYKLTVNAKTPADYYELTFTAAGVGSGKWSQTEKIYLRVTN